MQRQYRAIHREPTRGGRTARVTTMHASLDEGVGYCVDEYGPGGDWTVEPVPQRKAAAA